MRIIHLCGFPEAERLAFKPVVYHNVLRAIVTLIEQAQERGLELPDQASVDLVLSVPLNEVRYSEEIAVAVEKLWATPCIKEVFGCSNEFQLDDSACYFLDRCKEFASKDYLPSENDVLRARAKTTGIVEISFLVNKKNYLLIDVGGQRNERKKWIHCFQDVTSVIYCAAMNEYDLLLEEDGFTNRMHESLKVFEEVINSCYFDQTPIILFLNKMDLFSEKITRVDLSVCFPVYDDGLNEDKAKDYILKKFTSKNQNKKREIFTHFTTATNTSNVRFVFRSVEQMLIEKVLGTIFEI